MSNFRIAARGPIYTCWIRMWLYCSFLLLWISFEMSSVLCVYFRPTTCVLLLNQSYTLGFLVLDQSKRFVRLTNSTQRTKVSKKYSTLEKSAESIKFFSNIEFLKKSNGSSRCSYSWSIVAYRPSLDELCISSFYAAKIWTKNITEKGNFNIINMNQADNTAVQILRLHCLWNKTEEREPSWAELPKITSDCRFENDKLTSNIVIQGIQSSDV